MKTGENAPSRPVGVTIIAPLPLGAVLVGGVLLGDGMQRPAGESAASRVTFSAEILVL
jgi:hypothetical protein